MSAIKPASMLAAFSRARSLAICRCSSRPNSILSSIFGLPRRSASTCRCISSSSPTRWSNEQLCCWLRRIVAAMQHYRGAYSVEGCDHFSHDGDDDDLGFFVGGGEAFVEGFEGG